MTTETFFVCFSQSCNTIKSEQIKYTVCVVLLIHEEKKF